jgi:hypothetical protein
MSMGRGLMLQQEIKETVQQAYAATGAGETVARQLYSDQELFAKAATNQT